MPDESRLYCEGWPQTGERALDADELGALTQRVRGEQQARRQAKRRLRAMSALLAADTLGFVIWNPGEQPLALTIGAAFGILLFLGGALGSLYAAIWSARAWVRWMFRIALLCVVLMVSAHDHLPDALAVAVMAPALLISLLGGAGAWWVYWSALRGMGSAFAVVDLDLAEGRVLCFGGSRLDTEAEVDPAEPSALALEMLPRSGLLYRVDGELMPEWQTVELQRVAVANVEPWDLSYSDRAAELQRRDETHTYRERALRPDEVAELRRTRARLARRAIGEAVVTAWLAATLARLVESVLKWQLRPELSRAAWIAVGLIVVLRVWRAAATWRALGADLAASSVLRAWSRGSSRDDPPVAEILPRSDLIWTERGEPAGWRRVR